MKESYRSRSSDQSGPESCVEVPRGIWRSVDRGKCGLSIELRNTQESRVPTSSCGTEGNSRHAAIRKACAPGGVVDLEHAWTLSARKPGDPHLDPGGWTPGSVGRTPRGTVRMSGVGKSDECIVPKKSPNKSRGAPRPAEVMEERRSTKRSSAPCSSVRTLWRNRAETCKGRVRWAREVQLVQLNWRLCV